MPNLKDIRRRIGSVKSTQKITRAMKMVAAARLRRAQERIDQFRAYADLTSSILAEVSAGATAEDHPLLERREVENRLILEITSDRGLCGAFNGNLNRMVEEAVKEGDPKPELALIGRKAADYFRNRDATVREHYRGVYEDPSYATAARIASELAELYVKGEIDQIDLAFNEMVSMISQKPAIRTLLPVEVPEKQDEEEGGGEGLRPVGFIFEPDRGELLGKLLPMYVEVQVYRALAESIAAEHAARMTAMDNATNNAADMIDHLTLVYNRARQSAITAELMDIVGGAEALSE
jgi:F-type H+-transporting ATPase subunit gamma